MVPASFNPVQVLPANTLGRDFVTGDIHGAFNLVVDALSKVGFNPEVDRLLSTGDLVDRGEHSAAVLAFLGLPWVFAARGNHEQMALDAFASNGELADPALLATLVRNGMGWWLDLTPSQRLPILRAMERLPFVLQVETQRGLVGVLHADVPDGLTWSEFTRRVQALDPRTLQTCIWGRKRLTDGMRYGVEGIGRVFVGHTPQWDGARRYGNVYAVDTGAVYGQTDGVAGGALTMANVLTKSVAFAQIKPIKLLNILDDPAVPGVPFSTGVDYIQPASGRRHWRHQV